MSSPGLTPPHPLGCPSCAAAEAQCDRLAARITVLETRLEVETNTAFSLLRYLTELRFALGDDGKRMQDELLAYCRELAAKPAFPAQAKKALEEICSLDEVSGYSETYRIASDAIAAVQRGEA